MPINLAPQDVSAELAGIRSALIVYCPVCPQISLAMQTDSPWIELLKSGLKTGALEDHIQDIRRSLEQRGVRSDVFTLRLPLPTMCLWTTGQRRRLLKRARDYEAVIVLGCDSARFTAQQTLGSAGGRVLQGMKMIGITNATVRYQFPMTLELHDKTRVQFNETREPERDE